MTDLVQIKHLQDYTKCPNYCKYNWSANEQVSNSITRDIVESCYRDAAVLNKRVDWKTIRNRVYQNVFSKESNRTVDILYKDSLNYLNALRNWYLESYRDEPGEAICNLKLQEVISGVMVTANINVVLVNEKEITLIEFSEIEEPEEILKDIGLRTKIYLLGKEKILVNKVLVINTKDNKIKCTKLNIHKPIEWNYKTLQALKLMLTSINQKIFYPSVTSMCDNCKYRGICSW